MKKITAIVIGAGGRGNQYASIMKRMPDRFEVVGVAEPIESRRNDIKEMYGLSDDVCYQDFRDMLSQPKMADVAVICTMDDMHTEPALMAIERGYDLLLEKPVAQTPEECAAIANVAKERGVSVLVCHVLRYAPFYTKVKRLLMEGAIGDVMSVIAVEGVGNVHQSHSYVRGDWHREEETTPMLLAKCCHDLDILQWLVDKPCTKVSSFGKLTYFTPENAPAGAPERCFEQDCPAREECPYSCEKVYLKPGCNFMQRTAGRGYSAGFTPTPEEIKEGLRHTNFGACVFHAGNNVVDHQVVNMEFEGGATASLSMNAFNYGGRYIRIFGTKGELYANAADKEITVFSFATRQWVRHSVVETDESIAGGHGGGDQGMIAELYDYLSENYTGFSAADIDISVKNHMIGFAAERARRNDTVENVREYCEELGFEY